MSLETIRILEHICGDGPDHMAWDEALLERAAETGEAWFRTYQWDPPTLSLGYFQSIADLEADGRFEGVAKVRRPSGGGAIWHHHELTYALALPQEHRLARDPVGLYHDVHGAVVDWLASLGIAARRRGGTRRRTARERPFLCFTDHDPEDIVVSNVKVLGSAQRRRRGAIIQHGSLLLAQSSRVADLPGLSDLAPVSPLVGSWVDPVTHLISQRLRLLETSSPVDSRLQAHQARLRGRFVDASWWHRR